MMVVSGWSSVVSGNWSSKLGYSRGSIGKRGSKFSDWSSISNWGWGSYYGLLDEWFLVDDSVESVVWVSSVFDSTLGAVWVNEGVASLDDISAAGFVLAL